MRCDHCAHDVPDGVFCTRCGAHQSTTGELGNPKIHEFRWAFAVGLVGIVVLYVSGLITAAILVATFLVPVLYLIYLYEAQVYRDEPAIVLGFTIGGGAILGIVLTIIERALYNPFAFSGSPRGGVAS